jgi:hypothetical protein
MLMVMPIIEGLCKAPTTAFGVSLHAEGALSRRQPGAAKHGFGEIVGSRN